MPHAYYTLGKKTCRHRLPKSNTQHKQPNLVPKGCKVLLVARMHVSSKGVRQAQEAAATAVATARAAATIPISVRVTAW